MLCSSPSSARRLKSVRALCPSRGFHQAVVLQCPVQRPSNGKAPTTLRATPKASQNSLGMPSLLTRGKQKVSRDLPENTSSADGQKKFRLLTPYVLAQRISVLCKKGEFQEAISELKEAPRDAQNSIVWGSLIHEAMMTGKYKEGYRLFTDMKRRGIAPSTRTYGTMLGGYTRIENWEDYPLQLENVYSLYDQLKRHHAGGNGDLSNIPYTQLIKIFGQAQQFQRMYDVFNAMPSEGPLAPDIYTYTALLNAIANRKLSALSPSSPDSPEEKGPSYNELLSKNASDAKLIWRQLLRASAKSPGFEVDSHVLHSLLKILARGRPSDQAFAFDIVHEYLGLSSPGQTAIPAIVELHAQTLESLLHACNNAKRYNLTLHYAQQVIDSDSGVGRGDQRLGMRRILNRRHLDSVLEAHAALAGLGTLGESEQALETLEWMHKMQAIPPAPGKWGGIGLQIRPAASTYELVLLACWRGADWKSACRAFELMTGYNAEDFRGNVQEPPVQEQRSPGRALVPSAAFMSSMVRTASKTHRSRDAQQALNIFEHYGWDTFFRLHSPDASRRQKKDHAFYTAKLAQALMDVIPALVKLHDYDKSTKAQWEVFRKRAADEAGSIRAPGGSATTSQDTHQVEEMTGPEVRAATKLRSDRVSYPTRVPTPRLAQPRRDSKPDSYSQNWAASRTNHK